MLIYKDVYKKYENKSIGEKRKEEIRKTFENQISDIFNYSNDVVYYNRFFLYFHCKYEGEKILFEVEIEKLSYDFCYYLENDEIKSRYIVEYPQYVENEEEEAERLYNLFNSVVNKKKEIEKELDELKEKLSTNFKKNLYNDKISRTIRNMSFYW
jgi:type I restriction-modification system DNA methylase subunit